MINRFGNEEGIDKKWNKLGVNFSNKSVVESNSRLHDSVLMEAVKIIKEKYLLVDKPSRKTTILEIGFDHKDELLAKSFNENLVSIVNNFYFKTKTQKTGENLEILQRQADSVKKVLDKSILFLAEKDQSIPNPNPLTKVSLVPYQKALVDVQANGKVICIGSLWCKDTWDLCEGVVFPIEHVPHVFGSKSDIINRPFRGCCDCYLIHRSTIIIGDSKCLRYFFCQAGATGVTQHRVRQRWQNNNLCSG